MTDLASREWRLIRDEPRSGAVQMALEEVAAKTAVEEGIRTVRVYSWEPSTLSMGYGQAPESVDWAFCEREGIEVTRRQTGGGGIYHDARGDVSYTIVAPASEVPGDLMTCYELFCEPILEAFARMGVDADFTPEALPSIHQPACYLRDVHPAHDVVAPTRKREDEESEGTVEPRKISGNAQYRQRDVVIQHGSLSYELKPKAHLGVFSDHDVTDATFTGRVTSIRERAGIDRTEAVEHLASALRDWCEANEGEWSDDELADGRELAGAKYGSTSWIRDREADEGALSRAIE